MIDEQRIATINELLEQISPLNYERIFLETSLHFSKENNSKNYNEKEKAEIIEKEQKLKELNQKLPLLFAKLRNHQILYFVEYEGECSDASGQKYWHPQKEFCI